MRFNVACKITFCIMLSIVLITIIRTKLDFRLSKTKTVLKKHNPSCQSGKNKTKYILLWTKPDNVPFIYLGKGRSGFIEKKCPCTNCIVTANASLLSSYTEFDVIAFAGPELRYNKTLSLPQKRSPHQKYAFTSIESPHNYPLCDKDFNGFFNWTWTYKLDSELQWGYIVIRDNNKKIVGPKQDMHWIPWSKMKPVNETFTEQLKTKTRVGIWFVSNCQTMSGRERFVWDLNRALLEYDLGLDIYGSCGFFKCSREEQPTCNLIVSKYYYFYLAFENALSEDYVTEKLLIPLQNNAVPIVYGGANYTRFLPDGSYLNARELGVSNLAKKMRDLILDPVSYANMFRWKNHYSYYGTTESVETNEYCKMCAALNDEEAMKKTTIYKNFTMWWSTKHIIC